MGSKYSMTLARGLVLLSLCVNLGFGIESIQAQESTRKIRISNSALSVTSLPLLAAREWRLFQERGLDVEIILMSPALTVPAMISGDIDYFAGVGPGVVSASLGGLPFRAVWVSSNRVSYSLVATRIQDAARFKRQKDRRHRQPGRDQSRLAGHRVGKTRHVAEGF